GRLHTYWQGQSSNLEKKSDLVSVRRNIVRSRRNPKDAGDLSSRHELLTEIDSNLYPGHHLQGGSSCLSTPSRR
uniref:Uncharacterized protein n=1 Tax=Aegilops tauschii subsp. strangulata TaxID=200361 RepID=A0A453GRF9_AEGTS